jgi:HEAT repeat protein
MLDTDPDVDVRVALITALGKYVFLGELEKISSETLNLITEQLHDVATGNGATIEKRSAVESLGYSGDPVVPGLIEDAYRSGKDDLVCSALVAMGRSANSKWASIVLDEMTSDSPEVCLEAIKAAGELELKEGTETLIEFLHHDDSDIRIASIWALSLIGGNDVLEVLEGLLEYVEDDIEAAIIAEAIENLAFIGEDDQFSLFELGGNEEQLNPNLLDHTTDEGTVL